MQCDGICGILYGCGMPDSAVNPLSKRRSLINSLYSTCGTIQEVPRWNCLRLGLCRQFFLELVLEQLRKFLDQHSRNNEILQK